MALRKGDQAPAFTVKDYKGEEISLEKFRGKPLLLSFYRYASCPFCNLRVHELTQKLPQYREKGLEVVAVFESPEESIRQYVGKQNPPFYIVPDPDRRLYDMYSVERNWFKFLKSAAKLEKMMDAVVSKGFLPGKMEGDYAMVPADFLVTTDLKIDTAYYGADISNHIPFEKIEEFLGII